jgi:hypothetical protein
MHIFSHACIFSGYFTEGTLDKKKGVLYLKFANKSSILIVKKDSVYFEKTHFNIYIPKFLYTCL